MPKVNISINITCDTETRKGTVVTTAAEVNEKGEITENLLKIEETINMMVPGEDLDDILVRQSIRIEETMAKFGDKYGC